MLEGYLHLTANNAARFTRSCKAATRKPHRAANWRRLSTISRELVRNTGARGYRFKQAHRSFARR